MLKQTIICAMMKSLFNHRMPRFCLIYPLDRRLSFSWSRTIALTHHERLQLILELHALHGVQPARATGAEEQTMFVLQPAEDLGER